MARFSPTRAPEEDQLEPDPVIEAYKRYIDRTLLRENLKKSLNESRA